MATTMTVRPGQWDEMIGVWFWVMPDPLAGAETIRVTVHRDGEHVWVQTQGACAGVHFQTVPPDFA